MPKPAWGDLASPDWESLGGEGIRGVLGEDGLCRGWGTLIHQVVG